MSSSGPESDTHLLSALCPPEPRWVLPEQPPPPELVQHLARGLRLPEALCGVLVSRGITTEDGAKRRLRPLLEHLHPPEGLQDATRAVARLLDAKVRGETILVHGDYDVDGVAAVALYTLWMRRLGHRVVPFVPHRLRDGYDLGEAGIEEAERVGARVLLTADCGVVAHRWVEEASRRGIDVLVTDHHTPGATLPPAYAVVDPNRFDCTYPEKGLCGTAIAFKICQLMGRECGVEFAELLPHLDLVALATVADLVPLAGENRTLVRFGLRALATTAKPGLQALMQLTGTSPSSLTPGKIGFVLAPRLNAAGRLGESRDALDLLLATEPDEASRLATRLDELNHLRKDEDRRTLDAALEALPRVYEPARRCGVVLDAEGWHPGVIGIVASRLVELIHRPTVLVAIDGTTGRGSGRSIPGFQLYDTLVDCSEHLVRFGGHAQAAGLEIQREAIPAFRAAFEEASRSRMEGMELRPRIRADLELRPEDASVELCRFLPYLGPHGIGNPRPIFVGRRLELAGPARVVGKGHLKLRLRSGKGVMDAIGFGLAERGVPPALDAGTVDVLFHLQIDEYMGRNRVQASILGMRAASPAVESGAVPSEPSGVRTVFGPAEAATRGEGIAMGEAPAGP